MAKTIIKYFLPEVFINKEFRNMNNFFITKYCTIFVEVTEKHLFMKCNTIIIKSISIIGIWILLPLLGFAQSELKKQAQTNFEEKNYALALKQYLELYQENEMSLTYNRRIGQCFLRTSFEKEKAVPYLKYASGQPDVDSEVFFELALAHLHADHVPLAKLTLREYKRQNEGNEEKEKKAARYISICNNAAEMRNNPRDVRFQHLGKKVNSQANEFNPFITNDEGVMLFNSDRRNYTSNIYKSKFDKKKNRWEEAQIGGSSIRTISNDLLGGMMPGGSQIFVHNQNKRLNPNLYHSEKNEFGYGGLRKFASPINMKESSQAGADISRGGDTLFFASNREGGFGGYDIYMCLKLPNGAWGEPQNLGEVVNTPYDENYPNFVDEENTLYFASKGHRTMGGYDLFKSEYSNEIVNWKDPENLGYPINDTYDNKTISFGGNRRYAYIASNREEGYGGLDIYKVYFEDISSNYFVVSGKITTGDSTKKIPLAEVNKNVVINVYEFPEDKLYGRYSFDYETGEYVIALQPGEYMLVVKGPSFETYRKKITVDDPIAEKKRLQLSINLKEKSGNS